MVLLELRGSLHKGGSALRWEGKSTLHLLLLLGCRLGSWRLCRGAPRGGEAVSGRGQPSVPGSLGSCMNQLQGGDTWGQICTCTRRGSPLSLFPEQLRERRVQAGPWFR